MWVVGVVVYESECAFGCVCVCLCRAMLKRKTGVLAG